LTHRLCRGGENGERKMVKIDEIKTVCARLAGMGWQDLLKRHGLDITKADLAAELSRELAIDRSVPGFEDFTLTGKRGIEPGLPAASLLYHAFACPDVHPTATGEPATSVDAYPTLAELDSIENYTYSLRPCQSADLKGVVVGVFAYEYRPRESTAHGYHADFVFSRTGIARVGTVNEVWDGQRRGFRGDPPGQSGIAVTPARYAAFLAEARQPLAADPIMGRVTSATIRTAHSFFRSISFSRASHALRAQRLRSTSSNIIATRNSNASTLPVA
jgi:hypothetical protein